MTLCITCICSVDVCSDNHIHYWFLHVLMNCASENPMFHGWNSSLCVFCMSGVFTRSSRFHSEGIAARWAWFKWSFVCHSSVSFDWNFNMEKLPMFVYAVKKNKGFQIHMNTSFYTSCIVHLNTALFPYWNPAKTFIWMLLLQWYMNTSDTFIWSILLMLQLSFHIMIVFPSPQASVER